MKLILSNSIDNQINEAKLFTYFLNSSFMCNHFYDFF